MKSCCCNNRGSHSIDTWNSRKYESINNDSFCDHLLDYHYTKPNEIDGFSVPEILLSGNHSEIKIWRRKQSLGATYLKRPDLLKNVNLQRR